MIRQGAGSKQLRVDVRAFACTDEGKMRDVNEDACAMSFLDAGSVAKDSGTIDGDAAVRGVVLGVFDGTGSWMAAGKLDSASRMAAETIVSSLRADFATSGGDPEAWARSLAASIERAHRRLFARSTTSGRGDGSTATVATLCAGELVLAHVGDTRGYLLRGNELVRLTRDHTLLREYAEAMRAQGSPLTQEQIDAFPHRNVITRVLGMSQDLVPDLTHVDLAHGDVILLCSDGLWAVVGEDQIRNILVDRRDPETTSKTLLSCALDAGAPDNIAIVVSTFEGDALATTTEWSGRTRPDVDAAGFNHLADELEDEEILAGLARRQR